MIVVRMRAGLTREQKARVWNQAVGVLGDDRRLVGSHTLTVSDTIYLQPPSEPLGLGEHYAMIRKLNGIEDVTGVWQDNGARNPRETERSGVGGFGGIREFFRRLLGEMADD